MQSAEIFVICQGYLDPDYIDPRFFKPEFVFKENETDLMDLLKGKEVNSIKRLMHKKRRELIPDDAPLTMHKTETFVKFMNCENPYLILKNANKIEI